MRELGHAAARRGRRRAAAPSAARRRSRGSRPGRRSAAAGPRTAGVRSTSSVCAQRLERVAVTAARRRATRRSRAPGRRARSASPASARRRTSSATTTPCSADSSRNVPGRSPASLRYSPTGVIGVGQQPADHRDDPAVAGERAERLQRRPRATPRWTSAAVDRRSSARSSGSPSVGRADGGGSGPPASKQVRSPVWQAAPTWSTLISRASPSQSRRTALHVLDVAGRVALAPVLLAAAAPVGRPAGGQRAVQGLVVHPADHQHLAGVVLLDDAHDQAVGVTLQARGDGGVEGRCDGAGRHGRSATRSRAARTSPRWSAGLRHPGGVHRGVVAVARDEVVVVPDLHHAPASTTSTVVGRLGGREPVRDRGCCAAAGEVSSARCDPDLGRGSTEEVASSSRSRSGSAR